MRRRTGILVPALAVLCAAGCGEGGRVATRPPPAPEAEVPLRPGRPPVRMLGPEGASTAAAEAPKASRLDSRRLDAVLIEDLPLEAACQALSRAIGINLVASAAARPVRVTLRLDGVSARTALEGLCRTHDLWYREDEGMVRVLTAAEYGSELVVRQEDETRIYYLRHASALAMGEFLTALLPGRVAFNRPAQEASYGHVGTDGATAAGSAADASQAPSAAEGGAVQRTNYATSVNVSAGGGSAEELGRAAAQSASRGAAVVGTRAVAARGPQGGSAVMSVFLRNNCLAVRAVDESLQREIGQLIAELDTPTRQVLLEIKVLRLTLRNGFESFFNIAYKDAGPPQVSASFLAGAQTTGSTVSFGLLDRHITAAVQLMQTDGRLHVAATPMLLSANNAAAEFFSGVTRMVTTNYDYETRYSENGAATDIARPVVQEREIGTNVRIQPAINDDGTVTLRFFLQIGTVNVGGATISQIKGTELVQLPIDTVDNDRITSIVVANHGQTVVMGGLISESVSYQRSRVPGLADIPAVGMLFRKQDDKIERTESVILITPHIIAAPDDGAAVSTGVVRGGSAHPWVRHDRAPLTVWDEKAERLKAVAYPPSDPDSPPDIPPPRPIPAAETTP